MPVGAVWFAYHPFGMRARLGFAVAINVEADIFIADEALAVGDRPLKRKCKQRMREIRKNGSVARDLL